MENLAKQMRVRFSGLEQDNPGGPNTSKDRRLPLQKTQSFKGGRNTQNWLRRQFSGRQMNQDNDSDDNGEFEMAVAAATYAVNSLEQAGSQHPQKTHDRKESSLTRSLGRKYDVPGLPGKKLPRWFSDKEVNVNPDEASMNNQEVTNQRMPEGPPTNQKMPQQVTGKVPTIKKTPTFTDGYPKDQGSNKTDTRPAVNRTFSRGKQEKTTSPGVGGTKADAWERAEMERIQKKFERTTSTIVSWETEKRTKAKRRLDKTEIEIERRRARNLKLYGQEMNRIDEVAGGARAAAEAKRRNEETKAKEKANNIRATGKVPSTCFCF